MSTVKKSSAPSPESIISGTGSTPSLLQKVCSSSLLAYASAALRPNKSSHRVYIILHTRSQLRTISFGNLQFTEDSSSISSITKRGVLDASVCDRLIVSGEG